MAPQRGAAAGELEAAQVRSMFDGIAWVYDALNSAMTAGLHHRWRERAADLARVAPGNRVLDVATGTGDLALELARRVAPGGEVVGSDFSEGMLARARAKAQALARTRSVGVVTGSPAAEAGSLRMEAGSLAAETGSLRMEMGSLAAEAGSLGAVPRFEWGDALELPYADDSFDAATVGFGARNFSDLARGLSEMARVVRPGGRVVVLEFTTPTRAPLSLFYRLWFDRVVPLLGKFVGGVTAAVSRVRSSDGASEDEVGIAAAYSYLPDSVKRFPGPELLAGEMQSAGIGEVSCLLTAGGIVAIHAGTVPPNGP
jgi:demethylmenaquinone methyltransferase/2-methoxy-6-polyprenyl-1,4-benzoquinol methylase